MKRWLAGPAAFVVAWVLLAGLSLEQRAVGGVFAWTVAWWIAEPVALPVTALMATALLVLLGGQDERAVFDAYGDPIIPLFIGGFLLAKGMEVTRLAERLAWWFLASPWTGASRSRLLLGLGVVACGISLIVSNTATTAMLLPIGLGLLTALSEKREGAPYAIAVMLMLTWGSSVAVGVPVGTPPNLIALSFLETQVGVRVSFLQWVAFGMPITVLMLIGAWLVLRLLYRDRGPEEGAGSGDASREAAVERARPHQTELAKSKLAELGPPTMGERSCMVAFVVAVGLWVLPDVAALVVGSDAPMTAWVQGHVTLAVGAIVAAFLLFVLPAPDRPGGRVLTWDQAADIDWGTILLFAGGIALGQAMADTGLAQHLGVTAAGLLGADDVWSVTAFAIAAAIVLSEVGSNTASANILVPVTIGIAAAAGVNPVPPVLGVAMGASLGFMMPVSTPPNAIIYGSGLVPPREMMRAGLVIDVLGFAVTWLCLRLLLPLIGLA